MLEKIDFTFRDYVSFMFPGIVIIFSICFQISGSFEWLEEHKFVFSIVFFVGGYIAGRLSNSISYAIFIKFAKYVFGDPLELLSARETHFVSKMDEIFKEEVEKTMEKYWGKKLVREGSEKNLLILSNRKIDESNHRAIDGQYKRVSIHEFYSALIPAILALSISLIMNGMILAGILTLFLIYFSIRSYYEYRCQFAMNIYRLFYVLYGEHEEKK